MKNHHIHNHQPKKIFQMQKKAKKQQRIDHMMKTIQSYIRSQHQTSLQLRINVQIQITQTSHILKPLLLKIKKVKMNLKKTRIKVMRHSKRQKIATFNCQKKKELPIRIFLRQMIIGSQGFLQSSLQLHLNQMVSWLNQLHQACIIRRPRNVSRMREQIP